jgi:hypothetical protein
MITYINLSTNFTLSTDALKICFQSITCDVHNYLAHWMAKYLVLILSIVTLLTLPLLVPDHSNAYIL